MIVDKHQILKNYDGSDLTLTIDAGNGNVTSRPLTVLDVVVNAINMQIPNEVKDPNDITKITGISQKFYGEGEVDLSDEDRVFIKNRVMMAVQHNMLMPVVYGRICELFSEVASN